MASPSVELQPAQVVRAGRLALLGAGTGLCLGGGFLWAGLEAGVISLWGLGGALLLGLPIALGTRAHAQDGLGNRGLEGRHRAIRLTSTLQRLLSLGLLLAATAALMGGRGPDPISLLPGLAIVAVLLQGGLWVAKRGLAEVHPTLGLDGSRARVGLELSLLALIGLLGRWLPWADAVAGIALALRLFLDGQFLARTIAVKVSCGGCGSCGCR